MVKKLKKPFEILYDGADSYLGDKLSATRGCEVAVTARTNTN